MAAIWLTYSWDANTDGDVDFTAQELQGVGPTVKLDRWNLEAGRRSWEEIEKFIQDAGRSDAWLLYAIPNSLGSSASKEESGAAPLPWTGEH